MRLCRDAVLVGLVFAGCAAAASASLAVVNGRVWTGDRDRPWASAVAAEGERIAMVGSDAEVRAVCGPSTRIIDARGALVTPGFIDSHIHLLAYNDSPRPFPPIFLRFVKGKAAVAERIAAHAGALPEGSWILGIDWTEDTWGGSLPTRKWLDLVAPRHPVWLVAHEGNAGIANTAALRAAGITRNTPDEPPGRIVRGAGGDATGVIRGGPMWRVEAAIIAQTRERDEAQLERTMNELLKAGVTSVHHNNSWYDFLILRRLHEAGRLRVRVYATPPLPAWERLRNYIGAYGRGDQWMHWGGLKGYGAIRADDYLRWVSNASKAGLQVMVHVGGGDELRTLLEVFDRVRSEQKLRDPRFRVEHAHDMDADLIDLMAKVGAIASWQPPLLAHVDQRTRLGQPAPKNLFPFRALLERGVRIAFGTDVVPGSEIISPVASIRMALERAMSLDEALRAYTVDAAYAEFAEGEKGSLAVGKLADFVVMDDRKTQSGDWQSPRRLSLRDQPAPQRIYLTVVGGVVRFEASGER